MTNNIDTGQRYEVRATGYPKDVGENIIGWSTTIRGASQMLTAILKAPGCTSGTIVDRVDGSILIRRFGGVLR